MKSIHLVGVMWFALCAVYLLVVGLRQAGMGWWTVFSLSAGSLAVGFVLVSLYLYAVYRGATQNSETAGQHPLTSGAAYMELYYLSPLVGALGGVLGMTGALGWREYATGVALGTVGATFGMWLILDPLLGLAEGALPRSRAVRQERAAAARVRRMMAEQQRAARLVRLRAEEKEQRASQAQQLEIYVEPLVALLPIRRDEEPHGEGRAVEIGLRAWQIGGLAAMRQLHEMMLERYRERYGQWPGLDLVAQWWDGVGTWQSPAYLQEGRAAGRREQ